jgi:hypothetical protein
MVDKESAKRVVLFKVLIHILQGEGRDRFTSVSQCLEFTNDRILQSRNLKFFRQNPKLNQALRLELSLGYLGNLSDINLLGVDPLDQELSSIIAGSTQLVFSSRKSIDIAFEERLEDRGVIAGKGFVHEITVLGSTNYKGDKLVEISGIESVDAIFLT